MAGENTNPLRLLYIHLVIVFTVHQRNVAGEIQPVGYIPVGMHLLTVRDYLRL